MNSIEKVPAGVICDACLAQGNITDATRRLMGRPLCEKHYGPVPPFDKPAWQPNEEHCLCGQKKGHRGRCRVIELRKKLRATVHGFDKNVDPESDAFQAGMVLFAPLLRPELGQDEKQIAEWCGINPEKVSLWVSRLRDNKIWLDGDFYYGHAWGNLAQQDQWAIEFWLMVGCAEGTLQRIPPQSAAPTNL